MRFGKILAAAALVTSAISAPALANPAAFSVASMRAGASLEDESNAAGSVLIAILAIAAAAGAVVVIADGGDDAPESE